MMRPRGKGSTTWFRRYWPILTVTLIAILLVVAVLATTLTPRRMTTPVSSIPDSKRQNVYFRYTNMKGFFAQDDDATDPDTFNYTTSNLGLLNRSYPTDASFDPKSEKTQWQRFEHYVRDLNSKAGKGESYKVLYSARHGEGYHNVEEAQVGSPLWNCYWSRLDGNGNITWRNAELTPLGINQALTANAFWRKALETAKIPPPDSYYVSPLQRCLLTSNYTFSGVTLPSDRPFKPVIKELLREALGVHTCDQRDTKAQIAAKWPTYKFEDGFAEGADPLWDPNLRESGGHQVNRMLHLFDDIFANDTTSVFVSTTSHSGSISSMQQAVGHRQFQLQTGGVIPLFLKAEIQDGPRADGRIDPPDRPSICAPPAGASVVLTTTTSTTSSSSAGGAATTTGRS